MSDSAVRTLSDVVVALCWGSSSSCGSAVTRHPIYTGILGMLLGTTLAVGLGAWTALFVLGVVLAEVKIHTEERLLGDVFPGAYERYRRRVPQLIPSLCLGRGKRDA